MRARFYEIALRTPSPHELANFYRDALGYEFRNDGEGALGVAVDLRQISVQDDHVVLIHECLLETDGAVVGDIGRETMVP